MFTCLKPLTRFSYFMSASFATWPAAMGPSSVKNRSVTLSKLLDVSLPSLDEYEPVCIP